MRTKTATLGASLKRQIQRFYKLLDQGRFSECYDLIDPRIRDKPTSITRLQYESSLREFRGRVGSVGKIVVAIEVHENEPTRLYEGRPFALGKTTWKDRHGRQQTFSERWVREGRSWFTRSTGLLAPTDVN